MPEVRRRFDKDFREGAVRIVEETGKPLAVVARKLGVHEGALGNWVNQYRAKRKPGAMTEDERAELMRLRKRTPSCACSVMSSNDPWSCGSTKRWAASRDRRNRDLQDRTSHPSRGCLPSP